MPDFNEQLRHQQWRADQTLYTGLGLTFVSEATIAMSALGEPKPGSSAYFIGAAALLLASGVTTMRVGLRMQPSPAETAPQTGAVQ